MTVLCTCKRLRLKTAADCRGKEFLIKNGNLCESLDEVRGVSLGEKVAPDEREGHGYSKVCATGFLNEKPGEQRVRRQGY